MYSIYRQLALNLSLRMTPPDPGPMTIALELSGLLDGRPVQLTRTAGKGADVTIRTPLVPALDLGLGLSRTGMLSGLLDLVGVEDVIIGEPAFDAEFAIRADDAVRVAALLTPRLRAELFALRGRSFQLTDASFASFHSVLDEDLPHLELALREAVRVAQAFDEARAGVPPAAALAPHWPSWQAFARDGGLYASSSPLWMHGRLGSALLSARAVRKGAGAFVLEVSLVFEQPLGTRVEVKPMTGFRIWNPFAERPVASGDPDFDARFQVRLGEPDRVAELLDPDVRRMLLDLRERGDSLFVNDRALVLHATPGALDPAQIPALFEQLSAVADALSRNAQRRPSSAYR